MIVTGGDKRFLPFVQNLSRWCHRLQYPLKIYDLGDLGFGEPFQVTDPTFVEKGYYRIMNPKSGWCSRAIHKPALLESAIQFDSTIIYLDADAFPVTRIDEIESYNFDIGVTVRHEKTNLGRVNAGVLFLKNTENTKVFLRQWRELTKEIGNDQVALNQILQDTTATVMEFPTKIYNYYYFPEKPTPDVKIYHFKSSPEIRTEFLKYALPQ